RTRVRAPSPRLVERDRYALRAGVLLLLVAAGFVAGPDKEGRLAAAFDWRPGGVDAPATRIDAWIDPPPYTGKPPLVLLGPNAVANDASEPVSAPVGSTVVVRSAGARRVTVTGEGGLKPVPAKAGAVPGHDGDTRLLLGGDGTVAIAQDGASWRRLALKAIPDLPPRVALVGTPKSTGRGSLTLGYGLEDDYGVVGAEAHFTQPVIDGRPVTGRGLVEPPKGMLVLPATPGGRGEAKTTLDLSDHPWAGAHVTLTLQARDEAGNTGESKPVDLVLPSRPFTNPLARALVEQRRNLVLDPDHRERVALSLEALDFAPEVFDVAPAVHLGLRAADLRLKAATGDPELVAVADLLWAMAVRLEDGDLSQAEQDLRAAQKDLSEALARGAPPDEVKRLTEALRKQMDKLLTEMARKTSQPGQPQDAQAQASRSVTQKDLQSMLDRMEKAARDGDMAEAQRLLDQLNGIMNNLKSASRGAAQSQATREMNRSMGDLDRLMRDQGDVRDKTFKQGGGQDPGQDLEQDPEQDSDETPGPGEPTGDGSQPGKGANGQPGGQGGQPSAGLGDLQRRQGMLSQQLQALQKRMRDLGMKGEQGLADAEGAMKQAEGALGQGQNGVNDAVGAQGRALEGLQRGMKGLGQQMAQGGGGQPGQAQAPGEGDSPPDQGEDVDPLGRPRQGRGSAQGNQLDVSGGLAARAAQVMEELRRRLGDPTRAPDEQDYLERLLKRY
ncbi:TIGR02302 family protein, partial [Lichenihabitans sp. Uapishka_5]|uniref:TIGR02302 family protein n=1 Tax=Lichenihabitans sp. Uapishka_5 TaxID=3037302 RepID=UPI0029E7EE5C